MKSLKFAIPAAAFALITLPAAAGAADPCNAGASSVGSTNCVVEVEAVTLEPAPVAPATPVAVATPAVAGKQQLPVTGGDAATLIVIGGSLVGAGALLTMRSRRTSAAG